jgi:hypothetical protein
MRGPILIVVLVVLLVCGAGVGASTAATSAATELRITYWPNGSRAAEEKTWTLRCEPAGGTLGTLAVERAACRRLDVLKSPFARPNPAQICTQEYGGPDQAQITGTYEGRRVWIRLGLADGCQIARFKRLAFLIPAYS